MPLLMLKTPKMSKLTPPEAFETLQNSIAVLQQKNLEFMRAVEADRDKIVQEFAATLVHELNGPLLGIMGASQLLLKLPDMAAREEYQLLLKSVDHLQHKIDLLKRLNQYVTKEIEGQIAIDVKRAIKEADPQSDVHPSRKPT